MTMGYTLLLVAVLLTSLSQVLLKAAATLPQQSTSKRSLLLASGYMMLLAALGMNVVALRDVPLSAMAGIIPISYLLVPILAQQWLGERLPRSFWSGMALVAAGLAVFHIQ